VPGWRRRRCADPPAVLTAIDTSGSIDSEVLAAIAQQVGRLAQVARVTVAECDAAVQRVYRYRSTLDTVAGGGGTDLRPVFDPAFIARQRPDAIVYFTDGNGALPARPPPLPTFWVLTERNAFACPWGRRLWLFEADRQHVVPSAAGAVSFSR
jgi:predicted metal-dependent peptidase